VRNAIVSLGTGRQARLLRLARATVEPYARRHGYDLRLGTKLLDRGRPPPWSKIVALRELQDSYDLLLWLDADLMIVDGRRDVADELEDGRFLYLVEHETKEGRMPNSGVMLLRTGPDCMAFLDAVWAQEDMVAHKWWENAAIARLLGYELDPPRPVRSTSWRSRTKLISPRWNSVYGSRAPRPRIRHYPGFKVETRAVFMARDLLEAAVRRRLGAG
jgi:hypothetical protein